MGPRIVDAIRPMNMKDSDVSSINCDVPGKLPCWLGGGMERLRFGVPGRGPGVPKRDGGVGRGRNLVGRLCKPLGAAPEVGAAAGVGATPEVGIASLSREGFVSLDDGGSV